VILLAGLRTILDTSHDAVVSMDAAGRIVYWNPQAEAIFGRSAADTLGRVLADTIMPARFRAGFRAGLGRFLATGEGLRLGQRRELLSLRADGSEFPIELTASAVRDDGGSWTFYAFMSDISAEREAERERAQLVVRLEAALASIETRFTGVVDSLAEAVTIRDLDDRILYANRAALDSMGFASVEAMRAAPPAAIMSDYIVKGEDGGELRMADVPSVRLLRGDDAPPLLMNTVHRATGEEHWRLLKATGLRDGDGRLEAAITIIEDVTTVKRAELRNRLLGDASAALASSLDYEQTLRNVAWLAVPGFADWCAVDLVGDAGEIRQVVVAHRDPAKLELARTLRDAEPSRPDPQRGVGRVLRGGEPEVYPVITDEMLVAGARSPEHLELLREVGMSSAMIVPMRIAGRTIGAMSLVNAESRRRFDAEALAVATQLAERSATAVEHARLFRTSSQIAATLQRSLLPVALPAIDGWELAAVYRASGEEIEVGGDFYDAFPVESGWFVLIGDVTGKGVAAAAMTALVRHSARIIAEDTPAPRKVLARLDATLRRQPELSLCSVLCLWIDGARVTLGSAGHPPALRVGDLGAVRPAGAPGPLLGAFADGYWPETTIDLGADEALLLYTDGVTDTVGADGRFGDERLCDLLAGAAGGSAGDLVARLDARLAEFQVGPQVDDTAVLALRRVRVTAAAGGAAGLAAPDAFSPLRRG
jgi:PAS domain S-box-containing protein